MPGVLDSAGPLRTRVSARSRMAFWGSDTMSVPERIFRSSVPCLQIPLSNASSAALRLPSHGSGPGWFATPSPYDSFIRYSKPVYPGAIVAVGTAVASCPPHRPVLAQLAHTVPTSECATPSRSPAARVSPALYCTGVLWLGVQHRPMPGSLLGRPPSLRALRRRFPALVRALRRYYAVARLPAAVHEGLTAHRVLPPVRPTAWRTTTGSPGSRAWSFSACLGSQTPQDLCALAFARAAVLPSGAPTP